MLSYDFNALHVVASDTTWLVDIQSDSFAHAKQSLLEAQESNSRCVAEKNRVRWISKILNSLFYFSIKFKLLEFELFLLFNS